MFPQTQALIMNAAIHKVLSLSLDFFALVGFFVFVLGFTVYKGKGAGVSLLLTLYCAGFLFFIFPFWDVVFSAASEKQIIMIKGGIFFVLLFVIKAVLGDRVHVRFAEEKLHKLLDACALSAIISGIFLSYAFALLEAGTVYMPKPPLEGVVVFLFGSTAALFFWLLSSIFYFYFSMRRG